MDGADDANAEEEETDVTSNDVDMEPEEDQALADVPMGEDDDTNGEEEETGVNSNDVTMDPDEEVLPEASIPGVSTSKEFGGVTRKNF